jgi:hypothetical protein
VGKTWELQRVHAEWCKLYVGALSDIQPLMDSHPLLEWMIHHPKMEADHPKHMKVGAFC